ncbi:MAG: hypothetical protein Greene041662_517 [Candidatus Peregrinibacteria bacterium Greene0416_62]|nr:MAG: hypothetical protein Greene041662_517 [Candidatus Peregrinibacteria bacterium Greene0416_62]TSC98121.1 MAG: hypothetical protein Greene101449_977 [Candidatus Peregrinibacteria bacterium Greene1014_49]
MAASKAAALPLGDSPMRSTAYQKDSFCEGSSQSDHYQKYILSIRQFDCQYFLGHDSPLRPLFMRKTPSLFLGILLCSTLLSRTGAMAQTGCETVRIEKGEGEYRACLRTEREDRARQLTDIYRMQIDHQKKAREFTYDQRRTKADILWKQADFNLERQVQDAEQQISLLRLSHGDNPGIRALEVRIDELRQHRDLQIAQKDRMMDLYNTRQNMELTYLDVQFQRYTLSVRGYSALNFDW